MDWQKCVVPSPPFLPPETVMNAGWKGGGSLVGGRGGEVQTCWGISFIDDKDWEGQGRTLKEVGGGGVEQNRAGQGEDNTYNLESQDNTYSIVKRAINR